MKPARAGQTWKSWVWDSNLHQQIADGKQKHGRAKWERRDKMRKCGCVFIRPLGGKMSVKTPEGHPRGYRPRPHAEAQKRSPDLCGVSYPFPHGTHRASRASYTICRKQANAVTQQHKRKHLRSCLISSTRNYAGSFDAHECIFKMQEAGSSLVRKQTRLSSPRSYVSQHG